jgi:addiction module HigA family antidote
MLHASERLTDVRVPPGNRLPSVTICNLDAVGVSVAPHKTNTPLVVDAYTVLPQTVTFQLMAQLKPIHPGEMLREEFMVPLHLNANKLGLFLQVPAPTIYDIVNEERGISPEMALRLGYAFRTTPDFWLNLQSEFDLRVVRNLKEATVKNQVRPLEVPA